MSKTTNVAGTTTILEPASATDEVESVVEAEDDPWVDIAELAELLELAELVTTELDETDEAAELDVALSVDSTTLELADANASLAEDVAPSLALTLAAPKNWLGS